MAMPLGVLLSSLMTYGDLGEQFELTAIKSSGISLLRTLRPIFIFVVFLSIGMFYFNNHVVPLANLQAYSLLWDIKQTKPSLDIREGQFYSGLPNYSIKVTKKMPDGMTMKDVIIYNHYKTDGNQHVIAADSCKMYTFMDDRYLMMELYNGTQNSEEKTKNKGRVNVTPINQFSRNDFKEMKIVFSLASFDMNKTNLELFSSNKAMKNIRELTNDIDSMLDAVSISKFNTYERANKMFDLHMVDSLVIPMELSRSIFKKDTTVYVVKPPGIKTPDKIYERVSDPPAVKITVDEDGNLSNSTLADITAFLLLNERRRVVDFAMNKSRFAKNTVSGENTRIDGILKTMYRFVIEKFRKFAYAFTCLTMFLIGAPLGAIIKRGGLGFPVLISIGFFIANYVLTIVSEKWAKQGFMEAEYAVWFSNLILLPIGLYFLRQAKNDARLFDADFYRVVWDNFKIGLKSKLTDKKALVS